MKTVETSGAPQKPESWVTVAKRLTDPKDLLSLAMYLAWDLGPTDDFQLPKPLRRRRSDTPFLTPRVQAVADLYSGDGRRVPTRNEARAVAHWALDAWATPVLHAAYEAHTAGGE